MKDFFNRVNKKVNHIILSFLFTGLILIVISVSILHPSTAYMVNIVIGLTFLFVSIFFIIIGYKLWHIKREIEKYFKIK